MRGVPQSLLASVSCPLSDDYKQCLCYTYVIRLKFRAHWQLVVLCPMQDVVVWFCSLRKKPNIHIKAAINKLSVNIEDIMWSY